MEKNKKKIVVVLGTTASGKTKLAVSLARQFNGEIISADSRQVYRGLDVGSGKDLADYSEIKYHLIDVADPNNRFSVAEYQKMAYRVIEDILSQGKLPIIVGGSGQYLEAVVENYQLSDKKPDESLRVDLERKSTVELFIELKEKNPAFAEKLNNSDKNNKRRLIRYLEIFSNVIARSGSDEAISVKNKVVNAEIATFSRLSGIVEMTEKERDDQKKSYYDFLLLGLTYSKEILAQRIEKRLKDRLEKEDMIQEVSDLHDKAGLSWERLEEFGLEYKFIARYLQEKIDYEQMFELLNRAINQFAKKQMTWFGRWGKKRKIIWPEKPDEAEELVKKFLEK